MEVSVHYLMESGNKWKFIQNAMACLKDCADAHYIFLCEGSRVISCIEPREETVITQLWHGVVRSKNLASAPVRSFSAEAEKNI